jgi:hypothetical protein
MKGVKDKRVRVSTRPSGEKSYGPHKNLGNYFFNVSPQNRKQLVSSFYSKGPYNGETNKARRLITRAREREQSDKKKYLALSQKVVDTQHSDHYEYYEDVNNAEEPKARPYTTDQGNRATLSTHNAYHNLDRGYSRKQRFRGVKAQASSSDKTKRRLIGDRNRKQRGYFGTERVSSVDNFKSKKPSQNYPVYHEDDVKGLKIVDYFNGLNRLNRYIKKTKERLRSATRGFGGTSKVKPKIGSPFK